MRLVARQILLPEAERTKLDDDIRLFGSGYVRITGGNIGLRIEPSRIVIKPQPKVSDHQS